MKFCSQCKTEKPKADFYVRVNRPGGFSVWCIECSREKNREAMRRFAERNPTHNRDAQRKYRESAEFVLAKREKARAVYRQNPDAIKEKVYGWRANNPGKVIEWVSRRKASQLQATPAWANKKYIEIWYAFAREESARTGRRVDVDHIVPLKSRLVCGLHNEHNLQLLFSEQNNAKGNRVWPGMPDATNRSI